MSVSIALLSSTHLTIFYNETLYLPVYCDRKTCHPKQAFLLRLCAVAFLSPCIECLSSLSESRRQGALNKWQLYSCHASIFCGSGSDDLSLCPMSERGVEHLVKSVQRQNVTQLGERTDISEFLAVYSYIVVYAIVFSSGLRCQ